jgi:hypothetical protein
VLFARQERVRPDDPLDLMVEAAAPGCSARSTAAAAAGSATSARRRGPSRTSPRSRLPLTESSRRVMLRRKPRFTHPSPHLAPSPEIAIVRTVPAASGAWAGDTVATRPRARGQRSIARQRQHRHRHATDGLSDRRPCPQPPGRDQEPRAPASSLERNESGTGCLVLLRAASGSFSLRLLVSSLCERRVRRCRWPYVACPAP